MWMVIINGFKTSESVPQINDLNIFETNKVPELNRNAIENLIELKLTPLTSLPIKFVNIFRRKERGKRNSYNMQ